MKHHISSRPGAYGGILNAFRHTAGKLLLVAAACWGHPAGAATLLVLSPADAGPDTLRAAIAAAAPGDTIQFANTLSGAITLTSGELLINKDLTISGPGATNLSILSFNSRVFHITHPAVVVQILGLSLTGQEHGTDGAAGYANHADGFPGGDAFGGGIFNEASCKLVLTKCLFQGCKVKAGNGGSAYAPVPDFSGLRGNGGNGGSAWGGAIDNAGELFLQDCAFIQNSAIAGNGGNGSDGGNGGLAGSANGGALQDEFSNDDIFMANCTFVANLAGGGAGGRGGDAWVFTAVPAAGGVGGGGGSASGGAMYVAKACPVETCPGIVHCTISGNVGAVGTGGAGGAGLLGGANGAGGADGVANGCNIFFAGVGFLPMSDTIVAGGTVQPAAATVLGPDVRGPISSRGHNLIGVNDGSSGWMATDLQGSLGGGALDALLGPLQYNDLGPTPTRAPLACSPAIDAATAASFALDQIGHPRPKVVHRIVNGGDGSDIGAYELQTFPAAPSLSYTFAAGVLTLSWPNAPATACFVLQQTDDVLTPTWTDWSGPISVVGGQNRVSITPMAAHRFYRLAYP